MRVYGKDVVERFTEAYARRETVLILGTPFLVTGLSWGTHKPGDEQADVNILQVRPGVIRES
jgi:hypothetical protein